MQIESWNWCRVARATESCVFAGRSVFLSAKSHIAGAQLLRRRYLAVLYPPANVLMTRIVRMFSEMLKALGSPWLIPLIVAVVAVPLAKGLFGLHRSRAQDRRDFLDLWAKADKADDLWLQVAVRHVYGENLPAPLIRHLLLHPQAARGLVDLAFVWPLLDMDEATGEMRWRARRHASLKARRAEWLVWLAAYIFLAFLAFGLIVLAIISGKSLFGLALCVLALEMFFFAYGALRMAERMRDSLKAVPRWTAKLKWKPVAEYKSAAATLPRSRKSDTNRKH